MAVKKVRVTKRRVREVMSGSMTEEVKTEPVSVATTLSKIDGKKLKIAGVIILVAAALGLFWYKTNSWPVAAMVNGFPVMRFQLNQMMYQRVGSDALEELIAQRLIEDELKLKRVKIPAGRVLEKLGEIKTQLGGDEAFGQALAYSGMTTEQLEGQIKWQLGLEALVEPSTEAAVLQERVQQKVGDLRQKAKVWYAGK